MLFITIKLWFRPFGFQNLSVSVDLITVFCRRGNSPSYQIVPSASDTAHRPQENYTITPQPLYVLL